VGCQKGKDLYIIKQNTLTMRKSTNITDEVWKTIDEHPCIRTDMTRGLINTRALARYLIKKRKITASVDAVMSAIRRYDLKPYEKIYENALKIMAKTATISTKSPLANISLTKDTEIQGLLPKLFSLINYNRGDALRIIQANGSIKILVDEKNLKTIQEFFPKKKVLRIDTHIAEVNVHMHPDAIYIPGVLAVAANELAINNINLLEAMSCFPEWLWFVDEKDLLEAYDILYNLWHKRKE